MTQEIGPLSQEEAEGEEQEAVPKPKRVKVSDDVLENLENLGGDESGQQSPALR